MIFEEINYKGSEYRDDLLGRLRGTVFHLTPKASFDHILKDGFVNNNRDGRYGLNTSSLNSYGRKQGWVCLFDLRGHSERIIEASLSKYYFLGPRWFDRLTPKFVITSNVYMIVDPQSYDSIIPNSVALSNRNSSDPYPFFVPHVECWYEGRMRIENFRMALHVRNRQRVPLNNRFARAHHALALKEQNRHRRRSNSVGVPR